MAGFTRYAPMSATTAQPRSGRPTARANGRTHSSATPMASACAAKNHNGVAMSR